MWGSILGFLNGLLDAANKLLSAWQVSQERQAGRDEVNLKNAQRTINDLEKADAIDDVGAPTDRDQLLRELRSREDRT